MLAALALLTVATPSTRNVLFTADSSPAPGSGAGPQTTGGRSDEQATATTAASSTRGGGPSVAPPTDGTVCRSDGRMPGISYLMPPCVPVFKGDNGGRTARGVTADKVIVAQWSPQPDALTGGLVGSAGAADSPELIDATVDALRRYFNRHVETYGREVQFVKVTASGATSDDAAMRADAVHIAKDIGAFAVIASGEPQSFDEEAVAQGLICIPCGLSPPAAFYQRAKGFAFGGYPPQEAYYRQMAEYIGKRLNGRNAKWAGSPALQASPRKFGLIWVENSPLAGGPPDPDRSAAIGLYRRELAKYGAVLTADVGYQYDLTRVQEQATNAIVQMKAAGVSNLAFVGDAISPIFFTREATRQDYFPEWFITGDLATDNVILGRLYDPQQWKHAFGIGFVFVLPTNFRKSVGVLEYQSVVPNGTPASSVLTLRQPIETLFTGIHMAGAKLTPQSFAAGMYAYPKSGGHPTSWLTYFTPNDPTSVKDFKELWWNPDARGLDEQGHEGQGVIMNVNGGRRYQLGAWPTGEPDVFNTANAVSSADDPFYATQYQREVASPAAATRCRSCPT